MKQRLQTAFEFLLVLCALIVTFLVVRRELFLNRTNRDIKNVEHWQKLLTEGGHWFGKRDAPVKIIEFSDFECPFCRTLKESLDTVLGEYKDKVALIQCNFPLSIHPHAYEAAMAAECVSKLGDYSRFYQAIYKQQDSLGKESWKNMARSARVSDIAVFTKCMEDSEIRSVVDREVQIGKEIGVDGTPTLIINGRMVSGAMSSAQLITLINRFSK